MGAETDLKDAILPSNVVGERDAILKKNLEMRVVERDIRLDTKTVEVDSVEQEDVTRSENQSNETVSDETGNDLVAAPESVSEPLVARESDVTTASPESLPGSHSQTERDRSVDDQVDLEHLPRPRLETSSGCPRNHPSPPEPTAETSSRLTEDQSDAQQCPPGLIFQPGGGLLGDGLRNSHQTHLDVEMGGCLADQLDGHVSHPRPLLETSGGCTLDEQLESNCDPRPFLEVETSADLKDEQLPPLGRPRPFLETNADYTGQDLQQCQPRPFLETGDERTEHSQDAETRRESVDSPQRPRLELKHPDVSNDWMWTPEVSPASCKSVDSSGEYHRPDQTIIILDWDDTLCASTGCMWQHGLTVDKRPAGDVAVALEELASAAGALLEQSFDLAAKVVVVTNAEDGWVNLSSKAWLPSLQPFLDKCEVVSARSTWEPHGITSPAGWKAHAFEDVIQRFYSRYRHQSWKNIISVGDAPYEREALSRVSRWAPSRGSKCRSKSVKFVVRPTIAQLTRELRVLAECLREIVMHDDDLDLHFTTEQLQPEEPAHVENPNVVQDC